jgi:hypothetical protein
MNIELFNKLRKIRDSFKKITQLSFNISQMDRKFPLDSLEEKSYKPMLKVYQDFYKELTDAEKEIFKSLNE